VFLHWLSVIDAEELSDWLFDAVPSP